MVFGFVTEAIDAGAQLMRGGKDKTSDTVRDRDRRLQKLQQLREAGHIDEAEYAEQVRRASEED